MARQRIIYLNQLLLITMIKHDKTLAYKNIYACGIQSKRSNIYIIQKIILQHVNINLKYLLGTYINRKAISNCRINLYFCNCCSLMNSNNRG